MSNVSFTTSGFATNTYGVQNLYCSLMMTNVNVTASGGINTYGVYNSSSFAAISRSTMKGNSYSLVTHIPGGDTGKATVSQSTLIGPVSGGALNTCVACDDGSGKALDGNCKPIP